MANACASARWADGLRRRLGLVLGRARLPLPAGRAAGGAGSREALARGGHGRGNRDARRQYQIGIELAETGSLGGMARIGVGSVRHRSANIGYGVAPAFWGRGIASEAAALIVGFGFEHLGMHRIWATHHPENVASRRVLDKLGFREEGRRRDDRTIGGQWSDSVVCSCLRASGERYRPPHAG